MNALKYYILFLLYYIGYTSATFAQNTDKDYGFEVVFNNFSAIEDHHLVMSNSLAVNVFVDTDRIISIVAALPYLPYSNGYYYETDYISIHDLNGNQLALKRIFLIGENGDTCSTMDHDFTYCNNIEKLDNGNYFISGRVIYNPDTDSGFAPAFEYIFDKNGDSVDLNVFYTTDTSYLTPVDVVKSPTGELMSMYRDDSYNNDSLVWDYNPDRTDSTLLKYRSTGIRLIKHDANGKVLWSRKDSNLVTLISNIEAFYGIDVSADGAYYAMAAMKIVRNDSIYPTRPVIHIVDSAGTWLRTIQIPRTIATDSLGRLAKAYRNSDFALMYDLGFASIRLAVGKDGYIYFMVVECAPQYYSSGWSMVFKNQLLHYGKMDFEGNMVWEQFYDIGKGIQYPMYWSNIDIAPNGDIILAMDVKVAPNQGEKHIKKVLLMRADAQDGHMKWWKEIRTFDINESHWLKGMMVNPINGKIGIAGSVSATNELSAEQWQDADTLRRSIQGLINAGWLVLLDSMGRRCEADSFYGFTTAPRCYQSRLLVDPQLEIDAAITLYPNPTKDWITVAIQDLKEIYPGEVRCEVNDMLGRKLQSHILTYDRTNLDFTPYAPSIFMVNIFHNGKLVFSGKVRKE